MAIDPSIYNRVDTKFGLKLADLFNPAAIAQRQAAVEEQNMGNQLRQMQVMQGVEQMRRAPVLAQREEQQFQAQQAEAMRRQQEAARRQAMIDSLPEEQRRLLDFGVSPEKVLMPKELSPADVLAREKFEWEKRQPRGGDAVNWQTVTAADGSMVQVHPRTGAIRQLGIKGAAKADKPMTEFQGKSALFGSRAAAASDIIGGISKDLAGGASTLQYWQDTPLIGRAVNAMSNQQEQKLAQAQRDFVNAVLRLESGAAIGQGEFDNASQQYFPQPGDTQEVIQQKAQNRERAISGLGKLAGQSGEEYIGQQRESAFPATSVRLPDGRIKVFPSAAAAQAFKKQAGL